VTAVKSGDIGALADLAAAQAGLTSQLRTTTSALTRLAELADLQTDGNVFRTALVAFLNVPQPTDADWQAMAGALVGAEAVRQEALAAQNALEALASTGAVTLANASAFLDRHRSLVLAVQVFQKAARDHLASNPAQIQAVATLVATWLQKYTLFRDAQAQVATLGAKANQLKASAAAAETEASRQLNAAAAAARSAATSWTQAIALQVAALNADLVYSNALAFLDAIDQVRDPLEIAVYVLSLSPDDRAKLKAWTPTATNLFDIAKGSAPVMAKVTQTIQALLHAPSVDALLQSYFTTLAQPLLGKLLPLAGDLTQKSLGEVLDLEQQASTTLQSFLNTLLGNLGPALDSLDSLFTSAQSLEDLASRFIPNSMTLTYNWAPELKSFPSDQPLFEVEPNTKLNILAKITVSLKGASQSSYDLTGKLTDFKVNLIADPTFVTVDFASLSFESKAGAKPDFHVSIRGVELSDQLDFVKQLEKLFNPSTGPFLQLTQNGVLAGFRFGVPAFTLGAFNVQGLRLEISVNLPFTGEPMRLQLSVSDRDHPFLLSSGIFGGGGFFGLRLGLDGVELLEGALEFGAVALLNIGVASGSGYILAGIYFAVEHTSSTVSGFVRAGGEMNILGLMSMSLHIEVDVSYKSDTGAVEGTAEVDVEVSMLFVSISVHLTQHYQFAGARSQNAALDSKPHELFAFAPLYTAGVPALRGIAFAPTFRRAKGLADPAKFRAYRKKFAW
jgi:hypothetical protein